MDCQTKIDEFLDNIGTEKLLMETQFANIETILKENEELEYEKIANLLYAFNNTNIQYNQLCNDLILFIKTFKPKEEQEIRIYKTEELNDLFDNKISKMDEKDITF